MSAVRHLRSVNIEFGYCHCGCGEKTSLVKKTLTKRGIVAGQPRKYIAGHTHRRLDEPDYLIEDRGYGTPCWVWQKAIHNGYGVLRFQGRAKGAHIESYVRLVGPVPHGLQLDHLCRVRACVNPEHLEPVTQRENIRRGSRTKLTVVQVREIRRLVASGMSYSATSLRFGVSQQNVAVIAKRQSWKDVA